MFACHLRHPKWHRKNCWEQDCDAVLDHYLVSAMYAILDMQANEWQQVEFMRRSISGMTYPSLGPGMQSTRAALTSQTPSDGDHGVTSLQNACVDRQ